MNQLELQLKEVLIQCAFNAFNITLTHQDVVIEIPKDASLGDYATNLAMRLTKQVQKKPIDVAQALIQHIPTEQTLIESMHVAGPGFINIVLKREVLYQVISTILKEDTAFGSSNFGQNEKINLEYVSANPTGDLHPGHARGAAIGDSVARILSFAGYDVTREYYVNDAGNQINNMALSLQARVLQACGLEASIPQDGYHGQDLIDIANELISIHGKEIINKPTEFFKKEGLVKELDKIKRDLKTFNVEFDVFSSEQGIYDAHKVEETLQRLKDLGSVYESEGAVWLKTTDHGDDKDRVLVKSDGSYTYLLPDIAYHKDKYDRGFKKCVNFLGADHHGYIARLKASMILLGIDMDLHVEIIQMARMMKDGEEFKLSKRSGKSISLLDLIDEAGSDAIRYFFTSRAADTQMELDLDMATKQSNENPVYYAQYAHARVCSILRSGHTYPQLNEISLLDHPKEIELIKYLNEFGGVVVDAAVSMQPHKIVNYLSKVAALFHSFYGECHVLDAQNMELSANRLALTKAVAVTLRNALNLVGVSAPEKM
ncbi:MAG: arginine--tRNA ligase [Erysipelothrix sp.]|jgi:arginyl-tRNA synthetase|nr:arginine--tRNA ligase [Erysipelothrix sp.]